MKLLPYSQKGQKKTNWETYFKTIRKKWLEKKKRDLPVKFFPLWWISFNSSRNFIFCFVFQSFCNYLLSNFVKSNTLLSRVFLLKSRQELPGNQQFFPKKFSPEKKLFQKKKFASFNSIQVVPVFRINYLKKIQVIFKHGKISLKRENLLLKNFEIKLEKNSHSFLSFSKIFCYVEGINRKKFVKFLNLTRFKKIYSFSGTFSRMKGLEGLISNQRFFYGRDVLTFFLKLGFAKINFSRNFENFHKKLKKNTPEGENFHKKKIGALIEFSFIKFLRFGEQNPGLPSLKNNWFFEILPSKNKIPLKFFQKTLTETSLFKFQNLNQKKKKKKRDFLLNGNSSNQVQKKRIEKIRKPLGLKNFQTLMEKQNMAEKNPVWGKNKGYLKIISKESGDFYHEQIGSFYVSQFEKMFREEQLDIWLSPFLVFCFSSSSGFIEMIPNSNSLHIINQQTNNQNILKKNDVIKSGKTKTLKPPPQFLIESLAGYSLISFILQLKDRHNGNILLNKENRIIHIDFGFIFDFFPGNLKFEADSFKMSNQFLHWIGGKESEMFENLREIFIRGFLSVRKNLGRFLTLARVLIKEKKEDVKHKYKLQKFQKRFKVFSSDFLAIKFCTGLFKESLESWKTLQYDKYQELASGIEWSQLKNF